jgi:hypothetical protein
MQIKSLTTVLLVSVLMVSSYADVPDENRYRKIFFDAMLRINSISTSQHLPILSYDSKRLRFTLSPNEIWRTTVAQVNSPGLELDILSNTLEIVSFQRDFPPQEYINYDTPPKPAWRTDQAINEAKLWVKGILGRVPANIGKPRAEYAPGLNLPKYHEGTWTVSWPRIDSQGHLFAGDVVNVILSEKFGLIALSYIFNSKYTEGEKILVSREQAIEIGRLAAQKLLGSPLTVDWSNGMNLVPYGTAALWVVNPNHLLQYKSLEDMATTTGDATARLAWIVEYRAENAKGMGRYVDVWVDAQTKNILGGDFRD